jgi:hypothetical protein
MIDGKCLSCGTKFWLAIKRDSSKLSKFDKQLMEDEGYTYLLRNPLNKEERAKADWYFSSDGEHWDKLLENFDWIDYKNCKSCISLLKAKRIWRKAGEQK